MFFQRNEQGYISLSTIVVFVSMRKLEEQDLGLVVYRATLSCIRASKESSSTRDRERVRRRPKDRVGSLCPFCHHGPRVPDFRDASLARARDRSASPSA